MLNPMMTLSALVRAFTPLIRIPTSPELHIPFSLDLVNPHDCACDIPLYILSGGDLNINITHTHTAFMFF